MDIRFLMKEIEKVKENFFHSIKGTFSSPVNDSLENIEELLSTKLTQEQAQLVRSLEKKLTLVHRNTQNLAYLSDVKREVFEIKAKPFSLIGTFEKIVSSFQAQAQLSGVHLLAYIDPNAPKEIISDELHLIRIMENLILNAVIYTNRGGSVYVDLKAKHISDTEVTLNVSVTDTGVGISREKLKDYLKPFSHSGERSLGVGLSTSFHVLKAMGTQLKIASEVDKGSRFSFALDVQSSIDTMFESDPDIKIGVFIEDRSLFAYAKLLYQYIISMGLAVVSIKETKDENIKDCHGVFVVSDSCHSTAMAELAQAYKETCFIPAVLDNQNEECSKYGVNNVMLLPAMPSSINQSLQYIESQLPKEVTDSNENDHHTIQELAKIAETQKVKILVVEDNPINLKLVKIVLERYNFEIDAAENGRIALNMCKNERYSMVLMDIDMPIMDGITATKRIKEYEDEFSLTNTPIVALTSHDLAGERSEIMASGLDEHMPKPLNVARLELMLEHYLGFKPERTKYKGKYEN